MVGTLREYIRFSSRSPRGQSPEAANIYNVTFECQRRSSRQRKERTSSGPRRPALACGLSDQQGSTQDFFNSTLPPVSITLCLCLPCNADPMPLQQSLSHPPAPGRQIRPGLSKCVVAVSWKPYFWSDTCSRESNAAI